MHLCSLSLWACAHNQHIYRSESMLSLSLSLSSNASLCISHGVICTNCTLCISIIVMFALSEGGYVGYSSFAKPVVTHSLMRGRGFLHVFLCCLGYLLRFWVGIQKSTRFQNLLMKIWCFVDGDNCRLSTLLYNLFVLCLSLVVIVKYIQINHLNNSNDQEDQFIAKG